ncbi:MAG TPA: sortase [Candidatus Paceibacterota bacterium]
MTKGPHTLKKKTKKTPVGVFIATTVIVFFLTLAGATSIGFVPYYIDGSTPPSLPAGEAGLTTSGSEDLALTDLPQLGDIMIVDNRTTREAPVGETTYPVRILISSIDINLPVQNPKTVDINALDALLVNGPARYSASAKLGESGNVVIFAHSSHLAVVHNKMYKAFNNIPEASKGDTITLTGSNGVDYIYEVTSVVQADINDGTKIPLASDGKTLTLVTCDTLTAKSARYILTADFVGTN